MVCPCCPPENINDLDSTFNEERARGDAKKYLKKGLPKRAQKLIAYWGGKRDSPLSVLDIGCGAGGVHHELLKRGIADQVTGVDASSAYLAAAGENAGILHLTDQVAYHQRDFAQFPHEFETADLVVLDRVICCYPHLQKLLGAAADRAGKFLVLSYPVDTWYMRLLIGVADFFLKWQGSGYHPYVHEEGQVLAVLENAGMSPVHLDHHIIWRIRVFARNQN
jgi:magnesium-protoporphyrin O-methyltransferase